jgi:hemerythrin-like domain-containing protein
MCEYCGCQELDVVAELTAEHDRLRGLGRHLAAAVDAGDPLAAQPVALAMGEVLGPHTRVEEAGLFRALYADFGPKLDALVDEHRGIDAALAELAAGTPTPGWQVRTRQVLAQLFDHILKEQDGVFPAALATLTAADWESIVRVRDREHASREWEPGGVRP